jgi:alkylation response protein AidB-like acyl-CoA dehydrogenase
MYALLDEDQESLKDAVTSVASAIGLVNPSDLSDHTPGKAWAALGQMGLLELRVREGGEPAASAVEVMVTSEALGAHLVPGPFLPAAVLASELLAIGAAPDEWIEAAVSTPCYAVALRPDLTDLATTADREVVVWGGVEAEHVLLLEADDAQTSLARFRLAESLPEESGSVDLTQGLWTVVPAEVEVLPATIANGELERWRCLALSAVCADTVGLMRAALEGAVAYSKDRVAYGVPIGTFQALQHMAAETLVTVEGAYGATCYAAWCVDREPEQRALAARTAKAYTASVARTAAENVMQMYGGVGQTWEHIAHFYTRRALLNTVLFGDEAYQLDAIAQLQTRSE